jgi:hypothetical protein
VTPISDPKRELLRHTLATVAYRTGKTLRDPPAGFAGFGLGDGTRTPGEILAHICDLFDWAWHLAQGNSTWVSHPVQEWSADVGRFFSGLERLDALLASDAPLQGSPERLFQGPIADALTHCGQLAMLRRRAGGPVRGENYFKADITVGRVGPHQASAKAEFD